MRTVRITLDDELLAGVDEAVKRLGTTRSEFTQRALREALNRLKTDNLELKSPRKGGFET
jgi:metal-responsive CopG/Arc/MetJ family transcriptional regulator